MNDAGFGHVISCKNPKFSLEVQGRKSRIKIVADFHFIVGSVENGDEDLRKIADKIFKSGTQIVEHPLSV